MVHYAVAKLRTEHLPQLRACNAESFALTYLLGHAIQVLIELQVVGKIVLHVFHTASRTCLEPLAVFITLVNILNSDIFVHALDEFAIASLVYAKKGIASNALLLLLLFGAVPK